MLIPPFFLLSVVALGNVQQTQTPGQPAQVEWQTLGTGFLYGYGVGKDEEDKTRYEVYLVTAAHVVKRHKDDIQVRVNPAAGDVKQFSVPSNPAPGENTWFFHPDPDIDIGALKLNVDALLKIGSKSFIANEEHSMKKQALAEIGPGDGVFVLGFPLGLSGDKKNYVIARQGIIARVSEMLDGVSETFMIDASVYPGNSGGPVVLKPEAMAIKGTKTHRNAALIGVVTGYKTYTEVAISQQTGQPRIAFQENSGLAEVLPIDYVDEAIVAWKGSQQPAATTSP